MGKKGDLNAYKRASAFILEPKITPKVFEEFAERYKNRVGGYTRIHKYGNRPGDNAPHAVLELVDNPRDIKFEMTARTVGWELLSKRIEHATPEELRAAGPSGVRDVLEEERQRHPDERGQLRSTTRWNLQKVLRFRGKDALEQLQKKTEDHMVRIVDCLVLLLPNNVCFRIRFLPSPSHLSNWPSGKPIKMPKKTVSESLVSKLVKRSPVATVAL